MNDRKLSDIQRLLICTAVGLVFGLTIGHFIGVALAASQRSPIKIRIDKGPTVEVTVPNIARESLVAVLATFFANDDRELEPKFQDVLKKAKGIKLVLTTGDAPPEAEGK